MARPFKLIDWRIVEKAMEAGCSAKEIIGLLRIDINTFYNRFKRHYKMNFRDYYDYFYSAGNATIRFKQYAKAIDGCVPLLILLGKERLGQDKASEVPPNDEIISLRHENMALRAEIQQLKEKIQNAVEPETGSKLLSSD